MGHQPLRVTWLFLPVLPPSSLLIQIWSSPRRMRHGHLILTWETWEFCPGKKSFFVFHKNDIVTIKRSWLFVHWQSWICSQEMATPSPAPSSVTAAPCWPASEDEQHQLTAVTPYSVMPPSAVTTLSLHTPDLGQCTYFNQTVAGAVKPNNLFLWSTFSLMLLHWNTSFAYYGYCKKLIFSKELNWNCCATQHIFCWYSWMWTSAEHKQWT